MIVFAHRGLHTEFQENTEEAFVAAMEKGFDGVELDLRSTLDGQVVIHHDPFLKDSNQLIAKKTLQELINIDPHLMTLDRFHQLFKNKSQIVNFEIKDGIDTYTRSRQRMGEFQSPVISSFDFAPVEMAILDSFESAFLFEEDQDFREYSFSSVTPRIHLNINFLRKYPSPGLLTGYNVYSYTVNSTEDYDLVSKLNISGIFTDNPQFID